MVTERKQILLSDIDSSRDSNSRKDYGDLEELATRIKSFGLQGVVRVREITNHPDGKKYSMEDGHRRLAAVKELVSGGNENSDSGDSFLTLWAEVLPEHTAKNDLLLTQLALNTSQNTWSAYEQAIHIKKLLDEGLSNEVIQDKMHIGVQALQQRLSLLTADDFIKDALQTKEISFSAARAIIGVPDSDLRGALVKEAIEGDLSSRQVETRAAELAEEAVERATSSGNTLKTRKKKSRTKSSGSSISMRTVSDVLSKIEESQKDLVIMKDDSSISRTKGFIEGLQYSMVDKAVLASERKAKRV